VRRKKLCFILIVFIFLFFTTAATSLARDDWQNWDVLSFKKNINEKMYLKLSLHNRIRDDMSEYFFGGIQIGPAFKINKYLEISPSYFFIKNKNKGHFDQENRWLLDINLKWEVSNFKIIHRNRIEYRDLPSLNRWRYRDNIKIGLPVKCRNLSLMPYLSEEIFYEERKDEWNQNRFSVGVSMDITRSINFDIYYLLRSDRSGADWDESNVLGTTLTYSF